MLADVQCSVGGSVYVPFISSKAQVNGSYHSFPCAQKLFLFLLPRGKNSNFVQMTFTVFFFSAEERKREALYMNIIIYKDV